MLILVVLEWVCFDFVGQRFGSLDNTFDLLRHSAEIGLLAVAMTPVILTGGIDLSVGSLLGLCAIVFGKCWRDAHLPIWIAAVTAVGFGAFAGGVNASLITRLKLPPLIVTLATFSLFRGLAEAVTHGVDTFTGFPEAFLRLGQGQWLGLPAQIPVFVLIAGAIWLLVHKTILGRSWRAIGFAPEGARHAGLPVERRVALTYILSGLVAGIAAIIYTSRLGQAKADAGTGYELFAITAAVLGGTSIFGGAGSVYGTLLGVAAIALLNNGLVHARQPREVAGILTGVLLLVALALPDLVKRTAGLKGQIAPLSRPHPYDRQMLEYPPFPLQLLFWPGSCIAYCCDCMHPKLRDSSSTGTDLTVTLDGQAIALPAQRRSLASIRSYLEVLALEQQRVLFSLRIDGARVNLSAMLPTQKQFARVEAETIDLADVPLQLIKTARVQTAEAKTQVLSAVTLVLINDNGWAREHWWNLARVLNQPLLTLSLMPENAYGSNPAGASLTQLRKWQLQQLGAILREVDEAAFSEDSAGLSNALEYRVLPWLHGLETSLELWQDTLATRPVAV